MKIDDTIVTMTHKNSENWFSKELTLNVIDEMYKQDEINTLTDNIESLSNKIDSTVVCIKTLNEMVEMISKRVGLKDESE